MKWNFNLIFSSEEAYEKEFETCKVLADEVASFKGKLANKDSLGNYLVKDEELSRKLDSVGLYTFLNSDSDSTNETNQIRYSKLMQLYANLDEKLSSFQSELVSLGKEKLLKDIKELGLERFTHSIEVLFNQQDHILSKDEETLISRLQTPYSGASLTYDYLTVNDIKYNKIIMDGKEVEINHASYRRLLETTSDPGLRTEIFKAFYEFYYNHKSTFFAIYQQIMQQVVSIAKARSYKSILDYKLSPNNIDPNIYLTLVNTAKENTAPIKRYYELRKKYFKLDKIRTYDRFLPISKDETEYTYEKSKEIFLEALKHKTPEFFSKRAQQVLEDGRVDVFPRKGKASGAFSTHAYDIGTFIKLNHNDTLDSLFTLAHEAGHSMHSTFSIEGQDFTNHHYKIFVAEIASTFNEALLLDYLIETTTDKNKKLALIEQEINNILSTFFRQTLFATYELEAFTKMWNQEAITENTLSEIMIDLYKTYYGIDIKEEEYKQYVWAYIPHFYHTPFYVYQYATSFAASMALYQKIKNNEKGAFEKYITLLKAGNSKYPADIVKDAGCDLTKKETFLAVVNRLTYLINELEKLLNI